MDERLFLEGIKMTEITFPGGLKVFTTKEIIKSLRGLSCPLHGKKCVSKRLVGEIKCGNT